MCAVLLVPVGRPLPDVAGHVVQGRSRWRGTSRPARSTRSRPRAGSRRGNSPCQVLAMCRPPGANSSPQTILGAVEAAARGELPFGLGRQLLARPFGVGLRHPRTRRARPDDRRARRSRCPARADAASRRRHVGPPVVMSLSPVPGGAFVNTTDEGTSSSGMAPGIVGRIRRLLGAASRSRSPRRSGRSRGW